MHATRKLSIISVLQKDLNLFVSLLDIACSTISAARAGRR